jgi:outer membrane receptor protein involved in Fe transport
MSEKIAVEGGMRVDKTNQNGDFYLPRISFLYKPGKSYSIRLSGGSGYKAPNVFDHVLPTLDYFPVSGLKAERSTGVNADINYHTIIRDKISLQIDQAFYYTGIDDPLTYFLNTNGMYSLMNANYQVKSYGTDTYIRLKMEDVELYFGYNHTNSIQQTGNNKVNVPFNPKDKISATLAYEVENAWRMGIEFSESADQYIENDVRVPNIIFMAAMIERKFGNHISVVLNCENLTDNRQSKFGPLYTGTISHPVFNSVWAPLEGRVLNVSLKWKLR